MYVSVGNGLSILLCVVTIVSRCEEVSRSAGQPSRPTTTMTAGADQGDDDQRASARGRVAGQGPTPVEAEKQSAEEEEEEEASVGHNRQTQSQSFEILNPKPTDVAIECKALRSKRYITDGFCTSVKPIEDMVCTGNCLPISDLPWYAEFIKVWSRAKTLQYRCVDDVIRNKRVTFSCDSGETRSYKIRVVRSCKCKRYVRNQNESPADHQPKRMDDLGQQRRLKKLSNLSDGPK